MRMVKMRMVKEQMDAMHTAKSGVRCVDDASIGVPPLRIAGSDY